MTLCGPVCGYKHLLKTCSSAGRGSMLLPHMQFCRNMHYAPPKHAVLQTEALCFSKKLVITYQNIQRQTCNHFSDCIRDYLRILYKLGSGNSSVSIVTKPLDGYSTVCNFISGTEMRFPSPPGLPDLLSGPACLLVTRHRGPSRPVKRTTHLHLVPR